MVYVGLCLMRIRKEPDSILWGKIGSVLSAVPKACLRRRMRSVQRKQSRKIRWVYPEAFAKASSEYERHMREIHQIAVSGESIIEAMSTKSW